LSSEQTAGALQAKAANLESGTSDRVGADGYPLRISSGCSREFDASAGLGTTTSAERQMARSLSIAGAEVAFELLREAILPSRYGLMTK
jgi:hypothetical protein